MGHHAEVWGGNSRSQVLCMRKHAFSSHSFQQSDVGVMLFVSVANETWSQVKVGAHLRMRLEQCARLMVRIPLIDETSQHNLLVWLDGDSAVFC